MNVLRQAVKCAMSSVLAREKWMVRGPGSSNGIALTFDDGPHPEYTPRLLDELQRLDIVATFFVVGEAAAKNPEIVRRMAAEGHAVGTHSYTHSEPRQTSSNQLRDEVLRSVELCEDLIGTTPTLFRPPKGQLTWRKTWDLWGMKQTIVLWNQDPRDYQAGERGVQSWINEYRPARGDIVLMHDIHPHCIAAIESLKRAVEARRLGNFARIDEWTGCCSQIRAAGPVASQITAAELDHVR